MINNSLQQRLFCCVFLVLLLSPLHAFAGEPKNNNAADPAEQYRVLSRKLETLEAEQELLRFQKTFSETDSKYLILDLSAGKGMMLYRNRVLRTFRCAKVNRKAANPERGVFMMTGKIDGSRKKRELIFGSSFSFRTGRTGGERSKQAVYRLRTKDLAAMFYALDIGSKVFVK